MIRHWIQTLNNKLVGILIIQNQDGVFEKIVYSSLEHFHNVILFKFNLNPSPYHQFIASFNTKNLVDQYDKIKIDSEFAFNEKELLAVKRIIYTNKCIISVADKTLKSKIVKVILSKYKHSFIINLSSCILDENNGESGFQVLKNKNESVISEKLAVTYNYIKYYSNYLVIEKNYKGILLINDCEKLNEPKLLKNITPLLNSAISIFMFTEITNYCLVDLFTAFSILNPAVFTDKTVFNQRYSHGKINIWGRWQENYIKNKEELMVLINMFTIEFNCADNTVKNKRTIYYFTNNTKNFTSISLKQSGEIKIRRCVDFFVKLDINRYNKILFICKYVKSTDLLKSILVHIPNIKSKHVVRTIDSFKNNKHDLKDVDLCILCELDISFLKMMRCEATILNNVEIIWWVLRNSYDEITYKKLLSKKRKIQLQL